MNIFLQRYKQLGQSIEPEKIKLKPSLRANTLKIPEKQLIERLRKLNIKLEKIPFLDFGYYYTADFSLGATPEYLQGYYYLQEAASQIPVQILNPIEKEKVLDMAAAPGSKTTQIAQYMNNKGTIIALDNNPARLFSLRNNLERCNVRNAVLYKKDARFAFELGLKFDKILLDAPCSGNFVVEPKFFEIKTLDGIRQRAKLQKELLKSAVRCLNEKGVLVYSTCSLEPEENELNINWLLNKYPELKLEKISINIGDEGLTNVFGEKLNPEIKKCRRFWPNKTGTEGFFVAKIVKN